MTDSVRMAKARLNLHAWRTILPTAIAAHRDGDIGDDELRHYYRELRLAEKEFDEAEAAEAVRLANEAAEAARRLQLSLLEGIAE